MEKEKIEIRQNDNHKNRKYLSVVCIPCIAGTSVCRDLERGFQDGMGSGRSLVWRSFRGEALEAGLPAQEEALRRQQADIQERAQELSARAARCAELDAEAERRAQELPHENRAAAQRALVETRTQCEALQHLGCVD